MTASEWIALVLLVVGVLSLATAIVWKLRAADRAADRLAAEESANLRIRLAHQREQDELAAELRNKSDAEVLAVARNLGVDRTPDAGALNVRLALIVGVGALVVFACGFLAAVGAA